MSRNSKIFAARGGFMSDTFRQYGLAGCARKLLAAIKMSIPIMALGRRTTSGVGAYFDLITDDARMFYGDSFHFGYFKNEDDSFSQALDNHTDIVAEMAELGPSTRVLDIGCGICAPAVRIAKRHNCLITGINISAEQVKQAGEMVANEGLSDRITVKKGNALELDFADNSFDSILCLEVAGDICVKAEQKHELVRGLFRVLAPGGHVGFSDLVFTGRPTRDEEKVMRTILYHDGHELITDWPKIFSEVGFRIKKSMDIIKETMKTWQHSCNVYEKRAPEVEERYGKRIAELTMKHLGRMPEILSKYGSFIVMSAQKL